MKIIYQNYRHSGTTFVKIVILVAMLLSSGCDSNKAGNPFLESAVMSFLSGSGRTVTLSGYEWKKCSQGQTYDSATNSCRGNLVADGTYGASTLFYCSINDNSCNSLTYPAELIAPSGSRTSEIYTSCTNDTTDGYTDWRVPNNYELQSLTTLFDARSTFVSSFPDTVDGYYWTSTAELLDISKANTVSFRIFDYGETRTQTKTVSYYLRCVRTP